MVEIQQHRKTAKTANKLADSIRLMGIIIIFFFKLQLLGYVGFYVWLQSADPTAWPCINLIAVNKYKSAALKHH